MPTSDHRPLDMASSPPIGNAHIGLLKSQAKAPISCLPWRDPRFRGCGMPRTLGNFMCNITMNSQHTIFPTSGLVLLGSLKKVLTRQDSRWSNVVHTTLFNFSFLMSKNILFVFWLIFIMKFLQFIIISFITQIHCSFYYPKGLITPQSRQTKLRSNTSGTIAYKILVNTLLG